MAQAAGDTKTNAGTRNILLPASTAAVLSERKESALSEWIFPNLLKPEQPIDPGSAYLDPADLPPPQTSGQLGIEEVTPDFILHDDLHEHIQLLVRQYLLCPIAESGSGDLLGRVAGDQVRLLRRLQRTVERGVDAAHRTAGQTITQLLVEPLHIFRRDSSQLLIAGRPATAWCASVTTVGGKDAS